jgi:hypothetical protein
VCVPQEQTAFGSQQEDNLAAASMPALVASGFWQILELESILSNSFGRTLRKKLKKNFKRVKCKYVNILFIAFSSVKAKDCV